MDVEAVRVTFIAVDHDQPGGEVLPVEALRARVLAVLDARCRHDRQDEAVVVLPGLIRDLHTSIAAGRDVAELLDRRYCCIPKAPVHGYAWWVARWICGGMLPGWPTRQRTTATPRPLGGSPRWAPWA